MTKTKTIYLSNDFNKELNNLPFDISNIIFSKYSVFND